MNFQELLNRATATAYPEPDSPLHSNIIPRVVELFSRFLPPPARVLDIGCGSCFGAKELRRSGYDVTPISVLEEEVEAARELGFPAIRCEMHGTGRLGKFDAAWLRHAAEHSPCPLLLLNNLAEQSGWLYLEVPLPLTSAKHETNANHYSCLTDLGWANVIKQSGWVIEHAQTITFRLECGEDAYVLFICSNQNK